MRGLSESVLESQARPYTPMIRTYRYPLRPTRRQVAVFEAWLRRCAELYNAALEQRRMAWRMLRASVSRFTQTAQLTELRGADPVWAEVPCDVLRSALVRLDHAFAAFFRRVRSGEQPGYPRFRSARRYDSFGIGRATIIENRVRVPTLGWIRFHDYRPLAGIVRNVEIRRTARRWWVCVAVDLGAAPEKRVVRAATGIDLGLTSFAVLANGEAVANPRHAQRWQRLLRRAQQALARKQRGSRNRIKAVRRLARAHERVTNQRRDFHCKVAADLCRRFDLIAHEDLAIRGLARSRMAKSVADVGWGAFLGRLACKAESAGVRVVPVDPHGTTQECSVCGCVVRKPLAERTHVCDCGAVLDRDHNAAMNILARGRRVVACGGVVSRLGAPRRVAAPTKQEVLAN